MSESVSAQNQYKFSEYRIKNLVNKAGKIDDEILDVAKYFDELKDGRVSVRKMTATELKVLDDIKLAI